jgi:predicted RNA-binding Zn ribbon-like protein
MEGRKREASNLELVGGQLCLDFANTVSTRIEALRREYLITYSDLVAWSQHAGILADNEVKSLLQNAASRPDLAAAALERAIALRETIYRIFSAIADRQEPEKADLAAMNTALHEAFSRLEVRPSVSGFEWTWVLDGGDFDRILWPIVHSAADLLTSEDLGTVRQCARDGCDWLFVDSSKNHSRRWCSMNMCGSRIKARRYYQRRKRAKLYSHL